MPEKIRPVIDHGLGLVDAADAGLVVGRPQVLRDPRLQPEDLCVAVQQYEPRRVDECATRRPTQR